MGNTQDAGVPHIGCEQEFCKKNHNSNDNYFATSIAVVDSESTQFTLFEASPDITYQLNYISNSIFKRFILPNNIYITHAHIGHYTGLMYLGRESLGAHGVNVRVLPKMSDFLKNNGPWDQLIKLNNIDIEDITFDKTSSIFNNIEITPLQVPHRDEYSETAGYIIKGRNKTALFIPDIDKWERWDKDINEMVKKYDYLLLDATFYDEKEINRNINEIPHPLVKETLGLFKNMSIEDKSKIYFIHMNHTNMMLDPNSDLSKLVTSKGFNIARLGQKLYL
ncbi:MBL fold metallo-hydrolase [Flavobacteriaceae bacterium]|nr:MBL fold metallo-hydrolase [Flavobacteriaceae bacterium]